MGMYAVKPKFQKTLTPVKNFCVKHKISPTTLNLAGLLSSVLLADCLYFSPSLPVLLLFVPLLAFVRTAFNALDGLVSRQLKITTGVGEVLNEFLDRVSDAVIFFVLGVNGIPSVTLASATVIVILLNSYLSIVSKAAGGKRQYGGVMGKADRMLYLGIAAVVVYLFHVPQLWDYFFLFILLGTLITMLQRYLTITKELS